MEYLSYIVELAKKKGLMCSVKIGRADLPTITPINRGFFDKWSEDRRRKVERLDELKHKEVGGYRYGPSNLYPIHLAEELEVIKSVINDAAVELSRSNCQKYVIASDHGASRLAVLAKRKNNTKRTPRENIRDGAARHSIITTCRMLPRIVGLSF